MFHIVRANYERGVPVETQGPYSSSGKGIPICSAFFPLALGALLWVTFTCCDGG